MQNPSASQTLYILTSLDRQMASETIVAVFKTTAEAEKTAAELRTAGISPSAIEIHKDAYQAGGQGAELAQPTSGERRSGFWGWLLGEEGYQSEQTMYDQTIADGGAVLSVVVSDTDAETAYTIIEAHHPTELDERDTMSESAVSSATAGAGAGAGAAGLATSPMATGATGKDGETIALAEEQLTVGKREVQGGIARIRRYVVERPVEEQIKLRSESLRIERRPVSGIATVAADAFTDKVIEFTETSEEAVVGKTARVVEEVVIGKDVTERTETIRDTVRSEEIEVVKDGGTVQTTTSPATTPPPKLGT